MTAASEIEAAYQERLAAGLSLGPPRSAVVTAPSGGRVRHFAAGDIYWHANTGAFEVHGGILVEYQRLGGPGMVSPGVRLLGYPTSHETHRRDGRYAVSEFEFGAIYWGTGDGAVVVHGAFWDTYRSQGGDDGDLGAPILSAIAQGDAEVQFFEAGCLVRRASGPVQTCSARMWPRPGRPTLMKTRSGVIESLFVVPDDPIVTAPLPALSRRATQSPAIVDLWADRLALRPIGGGQTVPLRMSLRRLATPVAVSHHVDATPTQPLVERQLYDLVFISPSRREVVVSPHSVYAKQTWQRFGFMHITDMHVAGRNDDMYGYAKAIGAGADFVNFNDGLRETILAANALHAAGRLDVVLATGDLVDYVFEDTDDRNGGGNFDRLVDIVTGRSLSPSGIAVEGLRVPIFLVPGNHDYRPNPYLLHFDIASPVISDPTVKNYAAFNLTKAEADQVQDQLTRGWQLPPQFGGHVGTLSPAAASRMVETETPRWLLRRVIGMDAGGAYRIVLGPHRIVMVDTGHDLGIIRGISDAIGTYLGLIGGENEQSFIGGSPNQEGVTPTHLREITQSLIDAGNRGVVLVGMHGPPLNPAGDEYPHYFRETEHPTAHRREVDGYLRRRISANLPAPPGPTWSRTNTPWFKRRDTADFLDYGASRGDIPAFLRLIAGADGRRPADLVLCGHGHRRVDYRISFDQTSRELLFHMDFYFDQPLVYYRSEKAGHSDPVHIRVVAGAAANGTPRKVRDHRGGGSPVEYEELEVPPNSDSLGIARDKAAWWARRRPFVVQTAATGPIEASQRREPPAQVHSLTVPAPWPPGPTFRGFRIGQVVGPAIISLASVTLEQVRKQNYQVT